MCAKNNSTLKKKWWAPVWNGLVMDESGVHFRKMGNAIWLFLYLLLNANRGTGALVRKVKTISSDMGVPHRTISQWLAILKKEGYITTQNSGRFLEIVVNLWKTFQVVQHLAEQKRKNPHTRTAESCIPGTLKNSQNKANLAENSNDSKPPNDIILNILKNDIDIDGNKFNGLNPSALKTKEELIAYDLALALGDLTGFPLYLSYARKYPEPLLRSILGLVLEIPPEKINKSRGALFNYLIQKYASKSTNHPGD